MEHRVCCPVGNFPRKVGSPDGVAAEPDQGKRIRVRGMARSGQRGDERQDEDESPIVSCWSRLPRGPNRYAQRAGERCVDSRLLSAPPGRTAPRRRLAASRRPCRAARLHVYSFFRMNTATHTVAVLGASGYAGGAAPAVPGGPPRPRGHLGDRRDPGGKDGRGGLRTSARPRRRPSRGDRSGDRPGRRPRVPRATARRVGGSWLDARRPGDQDRRLLGGLAAPRRRALPGVVRRSAPASRPTR